MCMYVCKHVHINFALKHPKRIHIVDTLVYVCMQTQQQPHIVDTLVYVCMQTQQPPHIVDIVVYVCMHANTATASHCGHSSVCMYACKHSNRLHSYSTIRYRQVISKLTLSLRVSMSSPPHTSTYWNNSKLPPKQAKWRQDVPSFCTSVCITIKLIICASVHTQTHTYIHTYMHACKWVTPWMRSLEQLRLQEVYTYIHTYTHACTWVSPSMLSLEQLRLQEAHMMIYCFIDH
jgi:hypothetical protein